jgi:hypothetical protein
MMRLCLPFPSSSNAASAQGVDGRINPVHDTVMRVAAFCQGAD